MRIIQIAAALIDDDEGRLLLVRKTGTAWFMQAGGKIEPRETPLTTLRRELIEEIGWVLQEDKAQYLGQYRAPAANEPGHIVEAEVFHLRICRPITVGSEIEQAVWADPNAVDHLPLAPLTHRHILPLAARIRQ